MKNDFLMDYSKESTIDSRILKVCEEAERKYVYSKSFQLSQNNFNKEEQLQTISSFTKAPQQEETFYSPPSIVNNQRKSYNDQLNKNSYENNNTSNEFISKYIPPKKSDPNLFIQTTLNNSQLEKNYTETSSIAALKISNQFKHKTKTNRKINNCLHCLLKARVEQRPLFRYSHSSHIQFQQGCDINKILLDAKTEMKKFHFKKAYNMLRIPIGKGYYHSDLFYLYGELCRIIKHLEDSEDYLLLSLSFKHHSPYAFFSLGLLYQEISQFKYSNTFFKMFLNNCNTADVHFQMAKNYAELQKYLKSADHLTKAIENSPECVEYYTFRADIYKLIGLTELSNDDINMIKSIKSSDD